MKYLKINETTGAAIYATDIEPQAGDTSFVEIPLGLQSELINTLYYKSGVVKQMPAPPSSTGYFWDYALEAWVASSTITLTPAPVLTLMASKDDYTVSDGNTGVIYALEVFDSLTNDRASAVLKTGNYKPNEKRYVWARYVDANGSYSNWSAGATSGQMVTIDPITSSNTANSLVSSSISSGSLSAFNPTISTYGTSSTPAWYTLGFIQWTAQENESVRHSVNAAFEISGVTNSATPATDHLWVAVRTYLVDVNTASYVEGSFKQEVLFRLLGTKQYGGLLQVANMADQFIAGFRGMLTPGHVYRFVIDITKVREVNAPSCNITYVNFGASGSFSTFS